MREEPVEQILWEILSWVIPFLGAMALFYIFIRSHSRNRKGKDK